METKYHEQFIKFGLKVQYYRKLRGMTQETFADAIGKSWSFVAKIESPTRSFGVSMETMFTIADILNVPVSKLFEDQILPFATVTNLWCILDSVTFQYAPFHKMVLLALCVDIEMDISMRNTVN